MPTAKKRINISLPDEINYSLQFLAERDDMPVATKAVYLIRTAIELDEDDVLNKIAEERETKTSNKKLISHKSAWK